MMEAIAHEQAKDLFGPMAEGELSSVEAKSLTAHLSGCAECRVDFQQYERAVVLVREVGRERAPEGFATSVMKRIRRRRRMDRFQGGRILAEISTIPGAEVLVPVLIAACVAALLFLLAP